MTRINRNRSGLICAAVLALGAGSYWLTVDAPETAQDNENRQSTRKERAKVPTPKARVREQRVANRTKPKPVRNIRERAPRPQRSERGIRRNKKPRPKPSKPSRIG